jgi:hypothetical protein
VASMSYMHPTGCRRLGAPADRRPDHRRRHSSDSRGESVSVLTDPTDERKAFAPIEPERWRDKHGLAEHFSCGIRWIEERMTEGMPHKYIAGKAKFKISRVEPWLEAHGFIEDRGGEAA